jgi:hypothetical protein
VTDLLACLQVETPAKRWLRKYLDHDEREFCLIWPFTRAQNGYPTCGANNAVRPHRIMCERRHGPPPSPEHQAAHSCGNGHLGCVNQWHLNWKTPAENQVERHQQHGNVPSRKLTPEQVDEIRSMKSRERTVDTAARFQVSEANIRQIQAGKTWRLDKKWRRSFTAEEVALIRATPWQTKSANQWAREFGVKRSVIDRIRNGLTYRYFDSATPTSEHPSHQRHTVQEG